MPVLGSGLAVTPALMMRQVSIDMHFEPSIGVLARRVDKLGADIRSFREPLRRAVKEVIIPSIRQNFEAEGRPAWRELTDSRRLKRGSAHPILDDTGALRRTMGYLKIWHFDTEKALIPDLPQSVWYGKVHQSGYGGTTSFSVKNIATGEMETFTEEGEGGIPARPFIMIQDEDLPEIDRIFSEWVAERVRKAGLS